MIAGCDKDSLSLALLDEIENGSESLVVLKNLVDLSGRIVDVTSMVNSTALNHDEEALVTLLSSFLEGAKSSLGHLAQRRVDIVVVSAVNLKGNIRWRKQSEERQLHVVATLQSVETGAIISVSPVVLLLCDLNDIRVVSSAAALCALGQVIAATTAKHEINCSTEDALSNLLKSDFIFHFTKHNMRVEASRSRILSSHH